MNIAEFWRSKMIYLWVGGTEVRFIVMWHAYG